MKHIIDIDAWERRDNYGFFRSFVNSWYSVTTEIDCTEASAAARAARPGGHHFSDSRSWENILYRAHSLLRRL